MKKYCEFLFIYLFIGERAFKTRATFHFVG